MGPEQEESHKRSNSQESWQNEQKRLISPFTHSSKVPMHSEPLHTDRISTNLVSRVLNEHGRAVSPQSLAAHAAAGHLAPVKEHIAGMAQPYFGSPQHEAALLHYIEKQLLERGAIQGPPRIPKP